MDDLIEKVARAICGEVPHPDDPDWPLTEMPDGSHGPAWIQYSDAARTAIRAMLEGIDINNHEMIEAMLNAYWGQVDTDDAPMDHAPMRSAATAMIDHLREKLDDHEDQ